jgi:mannitol/fructose-specific phosphotransferase system IIA component (Ntr-type)
LLLPDGREGERLGALACFARKLRDPIVMTALRRARDGAEIYRSMTAD